MKTFWIVYQSAGFAPTVGMGKLMKITNNQIRALRTEAAQAGECVRVIASCQ